MINLTIIGPLHISFGGGFERWMYEVSARLIKLFKYKVTIITSSYGAKGKGFQPFPAVNYVTVKSVYVYPINLFELLKYVNDSDIIYVNMSFAGYDFISLLIKFLKDPKIVFGYHGPLSHENKIRYLYWSMTARTTLHVADLHHVLNEARRKFLIERGVKNIVKIPNGVDTAKFKPKFENKASNTIFRILYVGSLTYIKGTDLLIKLILKMSKTDIFNSIEFIIIGDGPLAPYMAKIAEKFNNVKYLGRVNNDSILAQLYLSANLYISLSRHEEFSLAPLEALSSGTPVITSNTPGPREYAKEPAVKLVNSVDEALKEIYTIYKIWNKAQEEYIRICKFARIIAEKYDWNTIVSELHKVFWYLLNELS